MSDTSSDAFDDMPLTGFTLIKDMSREELIEELVKWQRKRLMTAPEIGALRGMVVAARLDEYRATLTAEAGLVEVTVMGGQTAYMSEDEEQ